MHMLRKKYRIQLKIQNVINLTWTTRESLYSVNWWSSHPMLSQLHTPQRGARSEHGV